ncbi:hypothetical protein DFP72DRAFT_1076366 [Ephemerocybe angulata]|uniref:Uncharacterized protein n=1 Tax=Ephemerocybe angulata TaxID=980116 RepID=A0A8H6HHQ7_9AGAR|nr:hypothetical protein DFP72DRAFT_1076366 [Tulosesus angulatus]
MSRTIPLCVAADMDSEDVMKANPNYRRVVARGVKAGKSMQTICNVRAPKGAGETVVAGAKRKSEAVSQEVDAPPAKRSRKAPAPSVESLATSTHRTNTTLTTNGDSRIPIWTLLEDAYLDSTVKQLKAMCWSVGDVQDLGTGADEIGEGMKSLHETERRRDIRDAWLLKETIQASSSTLEASSVIRRAQLMVVTRVAWEWMDTNVEGAYRSLSGGTRHWLHGVALKVRAHIISGKPATFSAQSFLRDLFAKDSTFTASSRRNAPSKVDNIENFSGVMHHLLAKWFDFPNSLSEYAQGRFVKVVSDRFGTEVLYVSSVWEVYKNVARAIDPKNRRITTKKVDSWIALLTTTVGHSKYDGVHTKLRGLGVLLSAAARESTGLDKWDAQLPANTTIRSALNPFRIIGSKGFSEDAMAQFIDQIERLYPLLDAPGIEPIKPPRSAPTIEQKLYAYLKMVFDNTDKKLPFRDFAASRRTILQPNGPYSSIHLRTREGFFSALVYRAITHNSEFLIQHQEIVFEGVEDYFEVCQSYEGVVPWKEDAFFCDGCAYGAWTRLSPDSATQFWETTGDEEHNTWLLGNEPITFLDLVRKFTHSTAFPTMGPLIGYLLASDYALAGVVEKPTIRELGELVFSIRKGAYTGLSNLGFACATEDATAGALEVLHAEICRRLPETRRVQMGYDVFILEHMLCKFGRLSGNVYDELAACY